MFQNIQRFYGRILFIIKIRGKKLPYGDFFLLKLQNYNAINRADTKVGPVNYRKSTVLNEGSSDG